MRAIYLSCSYFRWTFSTVQPPHGRKVCETAFNLRSSGQREGRYVDPRRGRWNEVYYCKQFWPIDQNHWTLLCSSWSIITSKAAQSLEWVMHSSAFGYATTTVKILLNFSWNTSKGELRHLTESPSLSLFNFFICKLSTDVFEKQWQGAHFRIWYLVIVWSWNPESVR